MKTFLLDALRRIKRFDESLDIKTVLCNKPWIAFNDDGPNQSYIFKEDGGLIITSQGKGRETTWEFLSANKTIKIKNDDGAISLYRPTIFDETLLVLNLDTTSEYALLINESTCFKPRNLEDILLHIQGNNKSQNSPVVNDHPAESYQSKTPATSKTESRLPIHFAGETFTPVRRDKESFYVNHEQRYAFSSVFHIFEDADKSMIVKDKEGYFLFYYNGSISNVYRFDGEPYWKDKWDGLVLEWIWLMKEFLYKDGRWHHCTSFWGGYYRIDDIEGENQYFAIKNDSLVFATESWLTEQIEDERKTNRNTNRVLITLGVAGVAMLLISLLIEILL